MAHTVTLEPVVTVNPKRITESALAAHSAPGFGIPVIMAAGDDALEGQIAEELPNAEYAPVKRPTPTRPGRRGAPVTGG